MTNTQIVLIFGGIYLLISVGAVWLMILITFFLGFRKEDRKER